MAGKRKMGWSVLIKEADVCPHFTNKTCSYGDTRTVCLITQKQRCKYFGTDVIPSLSAEAKQAWAGVHTDTGLAKTTKDNVPGKSLAVIEKEILEKIELARLHGKAMIEAAAEIGLLLRTAKGWFKSDVEFGEWAQRTVGFSRQHRHRLMRLADLSEEKPDLFEEVDSWRAAEALWRQEPELPAPVESAEPQEDVTEPPKDKKEEKQQAKVDYDDRLSILQNQVVIAVAFITKLIGGELKKPRTTAKKVLDAMKDIGELPEIKVPGK